MGGHGEHRKWEHMGKGKTYMGGNERHGCYVLTQRQLLTGYDYMGKQ